MIRLLKILFFPAIQKRNELAYHLTEHLRMNGIYWGLTALALMGHQDALNRQEMIDWVMSCWDDEAGGTVFRRPYCI